MNLTKKQIALFFDKVDRSGDCWIWLGARSGGRYGAFAVGRNTLGAHRISWLIHHGAIPVKMHVLHTCDNPACVNPKHLFLGSHLDNMADMSAKQRRLKMTPVRVAELGSLVAGGASIPKAAKQMGISRSSAYQHFPKDSISAGQSGAPSPLSSSASEVHTC